MADREARISPNLVRWFVAVVGVGLVMASFVLFTGRDGAQWLSDALLTLGAAVLLIVPITWVDTQLSRRIKSVRTEVHADVTELGERVDHIQEEVEQRLNVDEVAAAVAARLAEDHAEDMAAFDRVEQEPGWDTIADALQRAERQGLIDCNTRAPRVSVTDSGDHFIAFRPGQQTMIRGSAVLVPR